jgi:hypothetical protein
MASLFVLSGPGELSVWGRALRHLVPVDVLLTEQDYIVSEHLGHAAYMAWLEELRERRDCRQICERMKHRVEDRTSIVEQVRAETP